MIERQQVGRPRSEQARAAILHAVDDLVVESGYGAVTLKGIAERAGVSRQTIYRWWSTKAEILLEASAIDARQELQVPAHETPAEDVVAYLDALLAFLSTSDAGTAYRALVGEAQHDAKVAELLRDTDPVGQSAAEVIERALPGHEMRLPEATAELVGPVFFWVLSGRDPAELDTGRLAAAFLRNGPGVSRATAARRRGR
ncbi:TetR/AcrR family transcriptional regulator [Flexivirga caeni]|uniref:TetR/AcrR family transcriptional regulator n=1 Tax=Flexivirga caeni TaxID=2294115 RepID=A0A3M9MIP1_9MICO|nr:TetR/AcrR family transcriptional regulator [Flexivirga caeni]RNI25449.1 TetR/AcrR family transcriptional regulator [Flexivirga caeni]